MKKEYSILDVIDPMGTSDTDDRDVYQFRNRRVISKTIDISEISTYALPEGARDVVSAQGFYTMDWITFFPIKVASISKKWIVIADSFPEDATGFLSIYFTKKSKDSPMAKYIVAWIGIIVGTLVWIFSYSPELARQIVLSIP